MGKRRNLKGLPNSLTQRYFSTLFYFDGGYMADWIWNSAEKSGTTEIKIDILNKSIEPTDLEMKPLTSNLDRLQETIKVTLDKNGFDKNFIKDAYFNIYISQKFKHMRLLTCTAILKDENGFEYKGKTYTEQSHEDKSSLTVQSLGGQSIWDRVKKWFAVD
jgi:hypothetical protein